MQEANLGQTAEFLPQIPASFPDGTQLSEESQRNQIIKLRVDQVLEKNALTSNNNADRSFSASIKHIYTHLEDLKMQTNSSNTSNLNIEQIESDLHEIMVEIKTKEKEQQEMNAYLETAPTQKVK